MGDLAAAREIVDQAVAHARAERDRIALVDGLRVRAMVAGRQGRWDVAVADLEEGLALARGMPYPHAEARLLHVHGGTLAGKGEPGPARERLEAALATFRRLGARRDAEETEATLATLSTRADAPAVPPGHERTG